MKGFWRERDRIGRATDDGVVLVNVLAVVALASGVAVTMLTFAESGIHRSQRFSDAAQALAYSMGAEASAIVVLRRDAEEAPEVDHAREPWAALSETAVRIEGGAFDLAIEDAQALFNVNGLPRGGTVALETLRKIVAALELPAEFADRILALIRFAGPVSDIRELGQAGIDDEALARLSTLITALPGQTDVNLNTASRDLLAILLGNPVSATFLVSRRDRAGFLSGDDLDAADILLAPGLGFTSNHFRVTITVTVGETQQILTSLLQRRERQGRAEVVAISRKRGRAAPFPAPPL